VESLQNASSDRRQAFLGRPPGVVGALPYASSTIVPHAADSGSAAVPGGCIPNPQAYMIQPQQPSSLASSDNFAAPPRSDVMDRRNDSAAGFQGNYRRRFILICKSLFSEENGST